MKSLRGGLMTLMTAGALVILPAIDPRSTRVVTRPDLPGPQVLYGPHAREFYFTAEEFDYVRPGFHITVNSITFNAERQAVVDVSFTDDLDQPLDRAGRITPGALSISFVLAWWDAGKRQYTSYTTRKARTSFEDRALRTRYRLHLPGMGGRQGRGAILQSMGAFGPFVGPGNGGMGGRGLRTGSANAAIRNVVTSSFFIIHHPFRSSASQFRTRLA